MSRWDDLFCALIVGAIMAAVVVILFKFFLVPCGLVG